MNNQGITKLRWAKHLTLLEVALELRISPLDYMKYESGIVEIPEDILEKIINYFKDEETS